MCSLTQVPPRLACVHGTNGNGSSPIGDRTRAQEMPRSLFGQHVQEATGPSHVAGVQIGENRLFAGRVRSPDEASVRCVHRAAAAGEAGRRAAHRVAEHADPLTLDITHRRTAHSGSVKSLAELPAGFLSAATDRTVAAGNVHHRDTLWHHGNLVNAVCVLAGRVAASASRDHSVKVGRIAPAGAGLWRAEQVQTLLGPDESVKCVGLIGDPDAPVVLAGSYDFALYAWRVDWDDTSHTLSSGRVVAELSQGLSCMVPIDDRRVAVAGWTAASW